MELAQHSVQWRAYVSVILKLQVVLPKDLLVCCLAGFSLRGSVPHE